MAKRWSKQGMVRAQRGNSERGTHSGPKMVREDVRTYSNLFRHHTHFSQQSSGTRYGFRAHYYDSKGQEESYSIDSLL